MKKLRNLHNGFQDSSGKTMTEVATPRTEATPAVTPAGAVEHRSQGRPVQGGGRCRGREGHETKLVGTGRSVEGNPANLIAIEENDDLPEPPLHETNNYHFETVIKKKSTVRRLYMIGKIRRVRVKQPVTAARPSPTTYL